MGSSPSLHSPPLTLEWRRDEVKRVRYSQYKRAWEWWGWDIANNNFTKTNSCPSYSEHVCVCKLYPVYDSYVAIVGENYMNIFSRNSHPLGGTGIHGKRQIDSLKLYGDLDGGVYVSYFSEDKSIFARFRIVTSTSPGTFISSSLDDRDPLQEEERKEIAPILSSPAVLFETKPIVELNFVLPPSLMEIERVEKDLFSSFSDISLCSDLIKEINSYINDHSLV